MTKKKCTQKDRISCFKYTKDCKPDECPDRERCGCKSGPRWGINQVGDYTPEKEKARQEQIEFS